MMTPPMQPALADDLVSLRPMREGDFDALFAVASDPAIWAVHPAHDRWQEPVFRAFFDEGLAAGGSLIAHDAATRVMIGHSRYDTDYCATGEVADRPNAGRRHGSRPGSARHLSHRSRGIRERTACPATVNVSVMPNC